MISLSTSASPNHLIINIEPDPCSSSDTKVVDMISKTQEGGGYNSEGTEVTSNTDSVEKKKKVKTHNSSSERSKASSRELTCDADGCINVATKSCSRCHLVFYCSPICQRAHWKLHKLYCCCTGSGTRRTASPTSVTQTPSSRRGQQQRQYQQRPTPRLPPRAKSAPTKTSTSSAEADEKSVGAISLRSKPSIIKVANDIEEDFERFQEVDDDDKLSNSSHHHHHHAIASSGFTTTSSTQATPHSSSSCFIALTEERVRAHLRDYYEDFDSIFRLGKSSRVAWDSFFGQYFTPDIQWVRSSSNSLTGPELAEHFANDIVGIRMKLVEINSIQILAAGTSAVVTFTAHQKYEYRGKPESDRTKITMVLTTTNDGREIRIAHEHRCTGKEVPEDYNWD